MPRFANMLVNGMENRGHQVAVWSPKPVLVKLSGNNTLKKWLGYIDQYIFFPIQVKRNIRKVDDNTLFVFCDNALGPWIPLVKNKAHVIHCHDFLAQLSAIGEIKQNPTSLTGRVYQKYIRKGLSKGKNFISVSKSTKNYLSLFLDKTPQISEVVYNGLSREFVPKPVVETREQLSDYCKRNLSEGYILHVGGNQWYKNRIGVIEIYDAWRKNYTSNLPLILIGEKPSNLLLETKENSSFRNDIIFLSGVTDSVVDAFYTGADLFLFPSLAEGFGWPIAEAMASGTLVITTDEAPMNEVASKAGSYVPLRPIVKEEISEWANNASMVIEKLMSFSPEQRDSAQLRGLENVKRFDKDNSLDKIERIYLQILE
ncbi:hypothetical protein MHTCC0001_29230 [Flavobacteriaceae bacterium MHTCC 0001]